MTKMVEGAIEALKDHKHPVRTAGAVTFKRPD
jgi:hypothetical protein